MLGIKSLSRRIRSLITEFVEGGVTSPNAPLSPVLAGWVYYSCHSRLKPKVVTIILRVQVVAPATSVYAAVASDIRQCRRARQGPNAF